MERERGEDLWSVQMAGQIEERSMNEKILIRIAADLKGIREAVLDLICELENKEDAPELQIQPDNGKSPVSGNGTSQADS